MYFTAKRSKFTKIVKFNVLCQSFTKSKPGISDVLDLKTDSSLQTFNLLSAPNEVAFIIGYNFNFCLILCSLSLCKIHRRKRKFN